jgi:predicted GNAT family acetyltransferase
MEFVIEQGRITYQSERGETLALVTYSPVREGVVDIDHTFVSPALRGQGIAAQLMECLAGELRKMGLKALASCSYAEIWLERNRTAHADIIA